jgi:hypothetical protein
VTVEVPDERRHGLSERIGELTTEVRVGFARIEGTLAALVQSNADTREVLRDHEQRLRVKAGRDEVEQVREDFRDELNSREKRTYAVVGILCSLIVAAIAIVNFVQGG